ncbi:MAG TPA: hypothetical protein VFZ25_13980 [Chloroflexota bacterium]|nr:hypothetical protein [Chloroflexota bacterium]
MAPLTKSAERVVPAWAAEDARVIVEEIQQGRLHRTFSVLAGFAALASGFEAYAQHRRGAFDDWLMWTPVALTAPMVVGSALGLLNPRLGRALLPWLSLAMAIDGLIGFWEHIKGVQRLPGGFRLATYNITMGPPIFAPLFFLSVGLLGWLAAQLRPERLGRLRLG